MMTLELSDTLFFIKLINNPILNFNISHLLLAKQDHLISSSSISDPHTILQETCISIDFLVFGMLFLP